eukprot:CAMPEP_0170503238 /NCGR_PEP_ID=MMETSP0208-20121228/44066_1 /TAXON_ID=197538 /ORGANISM="Strombidium inclinatum, Strain S3" /LENGTH=49 /DNA_ID= /DNA_START= /DNA_END= /DNA_ORIENTATION=
MTDLGENEKVSFSDAVEYLLTQEIERAEYQFNEELQCFIPVRARVPAVV